MFWSRIQQIFSTLLKIDSSAKNRKKNKQFNSQIDLFPFNLQLYEPFKNWDVKAPTHIILHGKLITISSFIVLSNDTFLKTKPLRSEFSYQTNIVTNNMKRNSSNQIKNNNHSWTDYVDHSIYYQFLTFHPLVGLDKFEMPYDQLNGKTSFKEQMFNVHAIQSIEKNKWFRLFQGCSMLSAYFILLNDSFNNIILSPKANSFISVNDSCTVLECNTINSNVSYSHTFMLISLTKDAENKFPNLNSSETILVPKINSSVKINDENKNIWKILLIVIILIFFASIILYGCIEKSFRIKQNVVSDLFRK